MEYSLKCKVKENSKKKKCTVGDENTIEPFSLYMMTVNDFIKSQNSIQCLLTDFEEIIVIFGVR